MPFRIFFLFTLIASVAHSAGYEPLSLPYAGLLNSIDSSGYFYTVPRRERCDSPYGIAAERFTPSDLIDTSFQPDSKPNLPLPDARVYWCDLGRVIPLRSGHLLQFYSVYDGQYPVGYYIQKIDSRGKVDLGFGNQGLVSLPFYSYTISDLYEDSDGSFYGTGNKCDKNGSCQSYLFHLQQNGALDKKFGRSGIVFRHDDWSSTTVKISDGKITVFESTTLEPTGHNLLIYRYSKAGKLEPGFKPFGGKPVRNSNCNLFDGLLTEHFVYSMTGCQSDKGLILKRHTHNGDLDQSFGNGGTVFLPLNVVQDQKIAFHHLTDLGDDQIAVSTGIADKDSYGKDWYKLKSVLTYHLNANGQTGPWGTDEFALPILFMERFDSVTSVVDSKGRLVLNILASRWPTYWVRTTPMK